MLVDNMKNFKTMVEDLIALGYGRWDPELRLWHAAFTRDTTSYQGAKTKIGHQNL